MTDSAPAPGSDSTPPAAGADNAGTTPPASATFEPITSQEDFDAAVGARVARERAKFEKFDEYKTAAAELAQIRDGEKTELQKLTDQLAAVTAERDAAQRSSLVSSVAAAKGVPASALAGATREEREAATDALIAWRGEQATVPPAPKPSVRDLKSGTTGAAVPDADPKAAAAEALRRFRSGT